MKRTLCILFLALASIYTPTRTVQADENPRILFITQSKGFMHSSVRREEGQRAPAELAMMQLAKDSGEFTVECSQNAIADVTRENLQKFDIVAFYTTGDLGIKQADIEYFLGDWLKQKGHGFLGFHSATDTYKDYEPYWDLSGGTFNGHPWGAGSKVTMIVHDTDHPAMKPFDKSFEFQDEIYQYSNWQPEKCHVLMSLDMEHTKTKRPWHVPVSWCKEVGEGKMFYNNMGHREETWQDERFLKSIRAAVQWIDGKVEGDATPNPDVSQQHHEHSVKSAAAAGISVKSLEQEQRAKEARRKENQARKAAKKAPAAVAN